MEAVSLADALLIHDALHSAGAAHVAVSTGDVLAVGMSHNGLRKVEVVKPDGSPLVRFIEQNPHKKSKTAQAARNGAKISWLMPLGGQARGPHSWGCIRDGTVQKRCAVLTAALGDGAAAAPPVAAAAASSSSASSSGPKRKRKAGAAPAAANGHTKKRRTDHGAAAGAAAADDDEEEEEEEEELVDGVRSVGPSGRGLSRKEEMDELVDGGTVVEFFDLKGPHGCLSNYFGKHPFQLNGKSWPTSEHYFQAKKFANVPEFSAKIREAPSPAKAAQLGRTRTHPLRSDWEDVKDGVMFDACYAKFSQHKNLQTILLATGKAKLVEHNDKDDYWGDAGDGSGRNQMGKILMRVRSLLRKGKAPAKQKTHDDEISKKLTELQDQMTCDICMSEAKDVAFGCGHQVCHDCSPLIKNCHLCKRKITTRIKLY